MRGARRRVKKGKELKKLTWISIGYRNGSAPGATPMLLNIDMKPLDEWQDIWDALLLKYGWCPALV